MTLKIFGGILIVFGCGSFGFSITAGIKREEHMLRQLISCLDYMQCELQFRMTPLPDLCRQAGAEYKNRIGKFFNLLADELENQLSADVLNCVQRTISCMPGLPERILKAFQMLGSTLGRFDLNGQIQGFETVRSYCRTELGRINENMDARLRSYQTLGICAGAALAILFV